MGIYILRRIFLFIPTLLAISLVAFIISINAPGDPVERLLGNEGGYSQNLRVTKKQKQAKRRELGLDLPVFYVSLGTLADIDTLHRVPDREHREMLQRMSRRTGNPEAAIQYYLGLVEHQNYVKNFVPDMAQSGNYTQQARDVVAQWEYFIHRLLAESDPELIALFRLKLDSLRHEYPGLTNPLASHFYTHVRLPGMAVNDRGKNYWRGSDNDDAPWKLYIPTIHWNGFQNQYHHWVSRAIKGDFGQSYRDRQPVMTRISQKFWWSFSLTLLSIIIAYAVSIPLGVYAAYRRDSFFDRFTSVVLFMLYSLPVFFTGTLLLLLFANPDVLSWFPVSGVQDPLSFDAEWPFWRKLRHWAPYLVLPLITYTYSSFAFISRQMRSGILEAITQDYIRTARAKGLSEKKVVWKHAMRNALLPVITIFAGIFPAVVAGSIIVETIFSIPGMGSEIYESIRNYDYPVIVAVFTIFGVATLISYLAADILYALADPRISYTRR